MGGWPKLFSSNLHLLIQYSLHQRASSSSSSPLSFGLVTYDSDSLMEVEEPKQIAAEENSSLELPQQSSEDDDQSLGGEGGGSYSGVAQESREGQE